MGYSRQHFYEIRRNFQVHGAEGVWIRNDLKTRHERLLRLEETVRKRKIKLTDEQIHALERFDPEFRGCHIEVHATGKLVAVDTFFAGTLNGVGKVYIQTMLDCFSRHVWARLYTSKMPVTAVQILNNHVLPFFEEHGVQVRTILSDKGREYCGRPDKHHYELFLQLEDIEHRATKVGRPQSNGFIERFHRTLLEEHLRIKGQMTWHETVEELQKDLDVYLETYNRRHLAPGPRHEGTDALRGLRGLQGRDRPEVHPQPFGRQGGAERSVGPDLREVGCQVNTLLVHLSRACLPAGRFLARSRSRWHLATREVGCYASEP